MKEQAITSTAKGVLWFDFYGFIVKILSEEVLLNSLYKDYSYFLGEEKPPDLCINVFFKSSDYTNLPLFRPHL